ncbi:MAG: hypothetical protein AAF581_08790 [Planctomycetota bacterium]
MRLTLLLSVLACLALVGCEMFDKSDMSMDSQTVSLQVGGMT